jgi:adenylate cyclase
MQAAARDEFALALDLYRQRLFARAAEGFLAVLQRDPDDGPSRIFLDRCRRLQSAPPEPTWDAVFRPDQK